MTLTNEVMQLLASTRISDLRKGLTAVSHSPTSEYCELLASQLERIGKIRRHWELTLAIVQCLQLCHCRDKAEVLFDLTASESVVGMVALVSAREFVRLARKDLSDFGPVRKVFSTGRYASIEGSLEAIGYDGMSGNKEDVQWVIEQCWDFGEQRPRGLTDPRYGLVAACSNWEKDGIVTEFLERCRQTGDAPIRSILDDIMNGKRPRLR